MRKIGEKEFNVFERTAIIRSQSVLLSGAGDCIFISARRNETSDSYMGIFNTTTFHLILIAAGWL